MSDAQKDAKKRLSLRDELRSVTVASAAEPVRELVDIGDGRQIEVRSLSYSDKKAVTKAATKTTFKGGKADIDFDQEQYELQLLIRACFVPDTNMRVYEPTDLGALKNQHVGPDHWMSKLIEVSGRLNSSAGNEEESD